MKPEYLRAAIRIEGFSNLDRGGDIILIMKDSSYASTPQNRFTAGVACKAWHGGLNPSDSYVPFILAYPGGNTVEINKLREGIKDCPDTGYCEECACGNWKVTDIVMKIILKQFGGTEK
jgi:hypothetical protein